MVVFNTSDSVPVEVDAFTKPQAEDLACNKAGLQLESVIQIWHIGKVKRPSGNKRSRQNNQGMTRMFNSGLPTPVAEYPPDDSSDESPGNMVKVADVYSDLPLDDDSLEDSHSSSWVNRLLSGLPPSLHWRRRPRKIKVP